MILWCNGLNASMEHDFYAESLNSNSFYLPSYTFYKGFISEATFWPFQPVLLLIFWQILSPKLFRVQNTFFFSLCRLLKKKNERFSFLFPLFSHFFPSSIWEKKAKQKKTTTWMLFNKRPTCWTSAAKTLEMSRMSTILTRFFWT